MEKKTKIMSRRQFLKYSGIGVSAVILTSCGGGGGGGGSASSGSGSGDDSSVSALNFTITDAFKEMVTHEPDSPLPSDARCYFWLFKEDRFPAEVPGPNVFATSGNRVRVTVKNELDGPHAFFVPGMVNSGPIAPGETWTGEFTVGSPGTYLYYDNLNSPVNRVMGLHGAFVVMPRQASSGHRLTPYQNPTSRIQQLFDDFGSTAWWPGLSWEAGDPATRTQPTRQYIWLCHQASPVLFAEVGEWARNNPGADYPAAQFVNAFVNDTFVNTSNDIRTGAMPGLPKTETFNKKPHFFTINGQSGFFSHDHPTIVPMCRVGEPVVVRMINAGLWTHSLHLHANHYYVMCINNVMLDNLPWVDAFNIYPMDCVDVAVPFHRPPDIPNERGIGRADAGLTGAGNARTYPPVQEFDMYFPPIGTMAQSFNDPNVMVDLAECQSPLCYPMHDHSEPTQTAQGGNYNCGLIAGMYFIGDRNGMMDFPMDAEFEMMLGSGGSTSATGPAAGLPHSHNHMNHNES